MPKDKLSPREAAFYASSIRTAPGRSVAKVDAPATSMRGPQGGKGTKFKREMLAKIEAAGGWRAIFDKIASGRTLISIARDFNVSVGFFRSTIQQSAELSEELKLARVQAAMHLAEEALEIADDVAVDQTEISKAREQIGVRRWLAEVFNRSEFGKNPAVAVNLQFGDLYLDRLRQRQAAPTTPAPDALPAPIAAEDEESKE